MTKTILASLFLANTALAANPGVICVASHKVHILIETQKKQVRVSHWADIVETLPILKTDVRYLESKPAIWRTSYDLGEGYVVETSFESDSAKGSGALYINGEEKIKYYYCSIEDDIRR